MKILRSNRPQAILFAVVLGFSVYLIGLFTSGPYSSSWQNSSPVFQNIRLQDLGWVNGLLGFVLAVIIALLLRYICDKHKLFPEGTQLSFLFTLLFLSLAPEGFGLSALNLGLLLGISMLDYAFRIQKSNKPNDLVFMGSLSVGAMALIYTPFSVYLLLIWIAYLYSGHTNLRGVLISVVGYIIPFYFYFSIAFLLNLESSFEFDFAFHWPVFSGSNQPFYILFLVLFVGLISIGSYINALNFNKIIIKNNFILLNVFAVLTLFLSSNQEFGYRQGVAILSFLLVPLLSNHFMRIRKNQMGNIQFYGLLLLVVVFHLLGL
ncbi:MAG: hypothetical protein KDC83_06585 [Flavobacteriales bacterium]|nr:hypothetical protein [Flavobacteriales bacterium]